MRHIYLILAVLMLLCLAPMPYGYFQLVRFVAMVVFGLMAYQYYCRNKTIAATTFSSIAVGTGTWGIAAVIPKYLSLRLPLTDYAVGMTRLAFCVFFVSTLQFACQSTLQAMDRPVVTFWLGLSRTLLLLVPLVWLLPRLFSSHADAAVFMAQPVVDVLVCAVSVLLLQRSLHNLKPKQ